MRLLGGDGEVAQVMDDKSIDLVTTEVTGSEDSLCLIEVSASESREVDNTLFAKRLDDLITRFVNNLSGTLEGVADGTGRMCGGSLQNLLPSSAVYTQPAS